jgi:hypothetical protein
MKVSKDKAYKAVLREQIKQLLEKLVKGRLKKGYAFEKIGLDDDKEEISFHIHTRKHQSENIILFQGEISEGSEFTCTMKEIGGGGDEPGPESGAYEDVNDVFEEVDFIEKGRFTGEENSLFIEATALAFKLFVANQDYKASKGSLYIMNLQKKYHHVMHRAMKLLKKEGEVELMEWEPEESGSEMFSTIFVYEPA